MRLTAPTGYVQIAAAALVVLGMAIAIGTALGFQHIGGYIPCKLCLEQRLAYYIGIPVVLLALVSAGVGLPGTLTRLLLLVGAALMAWTLALGVYHSGVEWAWWPGPTDCAAVSAPSGSTSGGVLDQLNQVVPPSCDQAAGRFLGLSFAGWNVVASFVIALIALSGAFGRAER